MHMQEQVGKARIVGYAIGLIALAVVVLWKFLIR